MKRQSKIQTFFKKVSAPVHNLNKMKDFVLTGEKLALEREKEIEKREKKVRKLQDEQILLAQKSKQARAELNALVLEKQVAEP